MQRIDLAVLADELAAARPRLEDGEQRLALTMYRLLAEGRPVTPASLADAAGEGGIRGLLEPRFGAELDPDGSVVAFWGLSLSQTRHRLDIGGRRLYAWCAWDALFLPALVNETLAVESACPTTGDRITLTVAPDGVRRVQPAAAVLSMRQPDAGFSADTRASFCRHVHFFASEDAFVQWPGREDATFAVTIDDGFDVASRVNRASYPSALRDGVPS